MVKMLLAAGADPDGRRARDGNSETVLHTAVEHSENSYMDQLPECVAALLSAGASVNAKCIWMDRGIEVTPIELLVLKSGERDLKVGRRLYPLLLKAGATLPTAGPPLPISRAAQVLRDPYLRKIVQAGGFPPYERRHVNALAATFGPKLGLLPEIARVVVAFAFHCGFY